MHEHELTDRFFETYPKLVIGSWTHCVYCGEPSNCRDHLWPFKMLSVADRKRYEPQIGPQAIACSDCNSRLRDWYFDTFEARCRHISERLRTMADAIGPRWERNEIRKIRGKLRKYVEIKQAKRVSLMERSQWFSSFDYLKNLESLPLEPILNNELPKFRSSYHDFFSSTIAAIHCGIVARQAEQRRSQETLRSRTLAAAGMDGNPERPTRQA